MIDAKVDLETEVRSVQSLLIENLGKKDTSFKMPPRREIKGIFKEVSNYDPSLVAACLGELGHHICRFTEFFDLHHPALSVVGIQDLAKLSDELCSYLEVAQTAHDLCLTSILTLMRVHVNSKSVVNSFCNNINFNPPIRAIKDPQVRKRLRAQARLSKSVKGLFYSEFKPDTKDWSRLPNTMTPYVRLNASQVTDAERMKTIANKYYELGMENQARTYNNLLLGASAKKNNSYCGFYQTGVEEMGTVLAKVHGFVLNMNDIAFISPSHNPEYIRFLLHAMCMSPKYIREVLRGINHTWNANDPCSLMEVLLTMGKEKEWLNIAKMMIHKHPTFCLTVRVYMASAFDRALPGEIRCIIKELENFHDYNDFPLFDHFLLMVPSINVSELFYNEKHEGYFFKDGRQLEVFTKREEASVFLDLMMIRLGVIRPLLMGQKGDQQFPITYW